MDSLGLVVLVFVGYVEYILIHTQVEERVPRRGAAGEWGVRRFFDWEEDEEKMKQNPLLRIFLKHKY